MQFVIRSNACVDAPGVRICMLLFVFAPLLESKHAKRTLLTAHGAHSTLSCGAVCCILTARLLHRSPRVGLEALLDVELFFAEAH